MRAWRLTGSPDNAGLTLEDVPNPHPDAGQILVRVKAAAITPAELTWHPTTHTRQGGARLGAVPAHEFSGIVAAVGPGVLDVEVGQEVFGMNDWFMDGAMAEFCLTRPEWIAPKPTDLSHAESASVPISALTAWQGLFDRADLQAGERLLVHGGSGGVGVYAIQLAARHVARVITTASARNRDFLESLGAELVIDYRTESFESLADGVDVIFDTVGGETLRRSWAALAPDGRLVTIASDIEGTSDNSAKKAFFIVEPNRKQLEQIAALLDNFELRPVIDAIVPFDAAGRAYVGDVNDRAGRGKVVVVVEE